MIPVHQKNWLMLCTGVALGDVSLSSFLQVGIVTVTQFSFCRCTIMVCSRQRDPKTPSNLEGRDYKSPRDPNLGDHKPLVCFCVGEEKGWEGIMCK